VIVTAQNIIAAVRWREQSLEEFAAQYQRLTGRGLIQKQIARHFGVSTDAARGRAYRARKAGLIDKPKRTPVVAPHRLIKSGDYTDRTGHQHRGVRGCDACQEARRTFIANWRDSRQVAS